MSVMCPQCGYGPAALSSSAEKRHQKFHYLWTHGVLLPPDMLPPDSGVLRVPANSPKAYVGLAHQMARVAQMALGKSFASFNLTPAAARRDWKRCKATAYGPPVGQEGP